MLISTKPDSKGKAAALARAAQLTEFKWTPVRDIPIFTKTTGKTVLPAGKEVSGMIYSSPEPTDKFIGENVSFETLLSIIANPDSAIYNKDLNGHNNSWAYFGVVCNGLARYALGIRRRYSTKRWAAIPGMRKIANEDAFTVDQIELCDVLHAFGNGRNHVALITDLLRDETGKIVQVEVSEAIRPSCVRIQYDVEAFHEKFKLFALWRYDYVDEVPNNDPALDALLFEQGVSGELPDIAVDYGNKSNYSSGEETVLSVFHEGDNEVEICRGEEVVERMHFTGKGKFVRKFDKGYYIAKLVNTGSMVEFCVNQPEITHSVKDGAITVHADAGDAESKILYMEFREEKKNYSNLQDAGGNQVKFYDPRCASLSRVEELTEEEKKTGLIVREIPEDGPHYKIYFENKYGVWTHTMIHV